LNPTCANATPPACPVQTNAVLFESSPDCVKILDLDGRLHGMNANGRCTMEIDDFDRLKGAPWHNLWPEEVRPLTEAAVRDALAGRMGRFQAFCPTAKGTPKWWDVTVTPVLDEAGHLNSILSVSRDITELHLAKEEQSETASRLRFMMDAAQVGEWDLDVATGRARTSLLHDRCFGYDEPVGEWDSAAFLRHVHPDDRARVKEQFDAALARRTGLSFEARVVWPDGSVHWISALGSFYGGDGRGPLRVLGTVADITRRKRAEVLAEGQRRALELAVAGVPLQQTLDVLTRAAEDATGNTIKGSVLLLAPDGRHLRHGSAPSLPQAYIDAVDGVEIGPNVGSCGTAAFSGAEVVARDVTTDPRWADYRDLARAHGLRACWSQPILSPQGAVLGTLAAYRDQPWEPNEEERASFSLLLSTAALILDRHREAQERAAAEQGLRDLAAELTEADRHKTEFLATLAHELRNPLAPIRNGLEVIQLAGGNAAAIGRVREMMARQVAHMSHLIDDLLDIARITSDKLELRKQRVDLRTVVATAVDASLPLIEAANHDLHVDIPDQTVQLDADPTRIAQVVSNLLNNAAKYTPAGGSITLAARLDGTRAVIEVRDTGIGIAPEALPHVFDMFSQLKQADGRTQGGLGIGLTLVRRLVEMHGGTVSGHSPGQGAGSTFTVELPVAAPAPSVREAPASAAAPTGPEGLRILVVDDNIDAADMLASLFQMGGHQVRKVHTGRDAVEAAEAFAPDVAFLDIGLPDMDGYAVARELRARPGTTPVLAALTGWGAETDRARSRDAGFDHHLTKPAGLDQIEAILAEARASRRIAA
jgi:PAS domain S-box-containing protein